MGKRVRRLLCREDKTDGKIYICPHCHRYVTLPAHGGVYQCFVCGGLVDTDIAELDLRGVKVKYDGKESWSQDIACPKCGGKGSYIVPITYFSKEKERRTCDLCHGTGKIDKEYYDRLRGGGQNV